MLLVDTYPIEEDTGTSTKSTYALTYVPYLYLSVHRYMQLGGEGSDEGQTFGDVENVILKYCLRILVPYTCTMGLQYMGYSQQRAFNTKDKVDKGK